MVGENGTPVTPEWSLPPRNQQPHLPMPQLWDGDDN